MSRTIGYIIVAGLATSALHAQDVAQMERRLDSTFREAVKAQQMVTSYRKAHPPRFEFSDSVLMAGGKVKVYFDSMFARQVRAGVEVADRHLAELGRAFDNAPPIVFSVVADSVFNFYDQRYSRTREMNIRQHFADAPNTPSRTSVDGDPQSIAFVLVRSVSQTLGWKLPSRVAQWTQGVLPIAPDLDVAVDWADIRLTLVSSPSHLGRSCYMGDVRACRVFLGLDTTIDNVWRAARENISANARTKSETEYSRAGRIVDSIAIHEYFDAAGRQRRVLYDSERARKFARVAADRCLSGNDEACVSVLYGMGGVTLLSSPFVRNSLVIHAIRLGGPKAAERLFLTPGTPGDALAAAAKMPLDSLIADWQRHLGERSRTAGNVPLTIALSSIAWVALCVFLSLRSSRWR